MKYLSVIFLVLIGIFGIASANNGDLDAANRLASEGIITKKTSATEYKLSRNVLRQEVIGTAVKLDGIQLPNTYNCKGYYGDLTSNTPNTWACRALEIAADNGIISRKNANAKPENAITKAEALAIVLSISNLPAGASSISVDPEANEWQTNLLRKAVSGGILSSGNNFGPNRLATRGEVFRWADAVANGTKQVTTTTPKTIDNVQAGTGFAPYNTSLIGSRDITILAFLADWCSTCQAFVGDIESNISDIPGNILFLDINYDTSDDLREKYNVVGQHTFVQVDKNGNLVKKWRGGNTLNTVLNNIQETTTSYNPDLKIDSDTIQVSGGNFFFEPNIITVKKGEEVTLTFSAEEGFHDFVVDELGIKTKAISGGENTTISFTPNQSGSFEFYCSIGNHRAQGMVGTIIVTDDEDTAYDYNGTLQDVSGGNSSGKAKAQFVSGEYSLHASFSNLPEAPEGYFYEGWVVRSSPFAFISTGATEVVNGGIVNIFNSNIDYTGYTQYVLTLEPDDGDPAPAGHILEGVLTK